MTANPNAAHLQKPLTHTNGRENMLPYIFAEAAAHSPTYISANIVLMGYD